MTTKPDILDTVDQIIRSRIPNLLRLYLNPFVAQTCLSLSRYVSTTWTSTAPRPAYPVFLANSGEETLSGAIKLARFTINSRRPNAPGRWPVNRSSPSESSRGGEISQAVILFDADGSVSDFATATFADASVIAFIPEVYRVDSESLHKTCAEHPQAQILVIAAGQYFEPHKSVADELIRLARLPGVITVLSMTSQSLCECRRDRNSFLSQLTPDIVVFDDSFVNHDVPFGAFAARADIYEPWMKGKMSTFHSTTFQPNTISTMHFQKCLRSSDPAFYAELAADLTSLENDSQRVTDCYGELFSPSLARMIRKLGFGRENLRAVGHYVRIGQVRCFDGVAGVACSIRGHNPETLVEELTLSRKEPHSQRQVSELLHQLTGLEHSVPAVSGATAVEQALRIALLANAPRKYVLALEGGYGGKTLLALTGTSRSSYKDRIGPLYPHVLYCDPFAPDAVQQLDALLAQYPVAVVQMELIQGVGGVREIPIDVLRFLNDHREQYGYLLFVDEIQTGMFRTGPFVLSQDLNITPDLIAIGKATSDMMFPFALTLFSESVRQRLNEQNRALLPAFEKRYGYETGYHILRSTLRRAIQENVEDQVRASGQQFRNELQARLSQSSTVREIRGRGLLIGIELRTDTAVWRLPGNMASQMYLLGMLKHPELPVLMGYCQYEPHVMKFTPPLSVSPEEIAAVSRTISDVLCKPAFRVAATGFRTLAFSR